LYSVLLALLFSCNSEQKEIPAGKLSFYHWQTQFEVDTKIIKQANATRLYVRFFDLYYSEENFRVLPKATLQKSKNDSVAVNEIVPVIYITNKVFEKITTADEIDRLIENTLGKIKRLKTNKFPDSVQIPEIQIDCDWTTGTRASYFSFLRAIKKHPLFQKTTTKSNAKISATIRLHQVKYSEKTGVPPVDKGTIMFYNVGDLGDISETNSILNLDKTKNYLEGLKNYPLECSIALPFFEWAVLYRKNKLAGILHDLTEKQMNTVFSKTSKSKFTAKKDAYLDGQFIYKGDKIRLETVSSGKLQELKNLIDDNYPEEYSVILYHLNSQQIKYKNFDALRPLFTD